VAKANVTPKRVKTAALGASQPQFDPHKEVESALIIDAELPSIQIADRLAREAPEDFTINVVRQVFLRIILSQRRNHEHLKHEQYRLPGMAHLPLQIMGYRNKRQILLDATFKSVQAYVNHLNAGRPDSAKQREAKALLEIMREASKKQRGITVRRALTLGNGASAAKPNVTPKRVKTAALWSGQTK
jgi:hypothetical protein